MTLSPEGLALLFVVGIGAGFLNVLAGGGSLITLPVMVFLGLSGPVANGTNRIAIFIQNLSAMKRFSKSGLVDWRQSFSYALWALPGTIIGALLGVRLEGEWFNRVLAGIMILVLVLMWQRSSDKLMFPRLSSASRARLVNWLMLLIGFYGGFIQAGVGFLFMLILHRILGLDLVRVNAFKVTVVGIYTVAALVVFSFGGAVEFWPGICLASGNATGAWIGAHVAIKKGNQFIRVVFSVAVVVMALKLLVV
jgi:uncharacterized membrane protein YfcA